MKEAKKDKVKPYTLKYNMNVMIEYAPLHMRHEGTKAIFDLIQERMNEES